MRNEVEREEQERGEERIGDKINRGEERRWKGREELPFHALVLLLPLLRG